MNQQERALLEAHGKAIEALTGAVQSLLSEVEPNVRHLRNVVAKSSIQGFMLGAALAEIAGGDRERLDRFLAKTVGVAEGHSFTEGEVGKAEILSAFNDIIDSADLYFAAR